MALELFHRLTEKDSALARQLVLESGLEAQVRFRNVVFPEAALALAGHGGEATPALWDGQHLHSGLAAVTARLQQL